MAPEGGQQDSSEQKAEEKNVQLSFARDDVAWSQCLVPIASLSPLISDHEHAYRTLALRAEQRIVHRHFPTSTLSLARFSDLDTLAIAVQHAHSGLGARCHNRVGHFTEPPFSVHDGGKTRPIQAPPPAHPSLSGDACATCTRRRQAGRRS